MLDVAWWDGNMIRTRANEVWDDVFEVVEARWCRVSPYILNFRPDKEEVYCRDLLGCCVLWGHRYSWISCISHMVYSLDFVFLEAY